MVVIALIVLFLIGGAAAAVTLLTVAIVRANTRVERRRLDALYAWTMANGWQLQEGDVPTYWRQRLAHLSRFRIRRQAHAIVRGLPVTAADCHYTVHSTDGQGNSTSNDVSITVWVARLPGGWPDIEVRGRGLGSRMLRSLGRPSAIESGHPEFDQRFQVDAADPRAAHALLSPALVDAHLRGQAPQWSLHRGELVITQTGRLTPDAILPGVERLLWLAALLGHRA